VHDTETWQRSSDPQELCPQPRGDYLATTADAFVWQLSTDVLMKGNHDDDLVLIVY